MKGVAGIKIYGCDNDICEIVNKAFPTADEIEANAVGLLSFEHLPLTINLQPVLETEIIEYADGSTKNRIVLDAKQFELTSNIITYPDVLTDIEDFYHANVIKKPYKYLFIMLADTPEYGNGYRLFTDGISLTTTMPFCTQSYTIQNNVDNGTKGWTLVGQWSKYNVIN